MNATVLHNNKRFLSKSALELRTHQERLVKNTAATTTTATTPTSSGPTPANTQRSRRRVLPTRPNPPTFQTDLRAQRPRVRDVLLKYRASIANANELLGNENPNEKPSPQKTKSHVVDNKTHNPVKHRDTSLSRSTEPERRIQRPSTRGRATRRSEQQHELCPRCKGALDKSDQPPCRCVQKNGLKPNTNGTTKIVQLKDISPETLVISQVEETEIGCHC